MSALVAVARLGPAGSRGDVRADLVAMVRALAHRGAAPVPFVGEAAGLAHLGRGEARTSFLGRGPLRAAIDARLDEPAVVADALGAPRETSDAELLLLAWERWGDEAIARVLGDFAAAIWDVERRELALARDALGVRPLYFFARAGLVLAATEAHALAAPDEGADGALHRREAARYLVEQYFEEGPTLFAGVEVVPVGSVVRLRAAGRATRQAFRPDPFRRLSPADPASCAERLAEALDVAVRSRLRGVEAPCTLVSGGLDSSSVHVLASRAAHQRGAPPPPILHVAFPGLPCDEAPFVAAVARATGAPIEEVDPREHEGATSPASPGVAPGEIFDPSLSMLGPLFDRAARTTVDAIVLTGCGGDDLQHASGHETVDDLRAGRAGAAWRAARRETGSARAGFRYVARQALRAIWPEERRAWLRRIRPASWVWPRWLTDGARRELDRWHAAQMDARRAFEAPDEVQRCLALSFAGDSDLSLFLGKLDLFGAHHGVELRHPFYDRRVVELLLSLPREERAAPEGTKRALRRGLAGLLPELVRQRTDAADFSPYVDRTILDVHRHAYEQHFVGGALEREGVVEPGALVEALRAGEATLPWRAISIEVAIRTFREARASYAAGRG